MAKRCNILGMHGIPVDTVCIVASQVDLGDMQGIIVLNIPSYGGGVDLWTGATAKDSHELTAQVPVWHTHGCS